MNRPLPRPHHPRADPGLAGHPYSVQEAALALLVPVVLVADLVDPGAIIALLELVGTVGAIVAGLVVRGVWRILHRPLHSLTVADAVFGGLALRWWRQRRRSRLS
jgi:hypothetical protein